MNGLEGVMDNIWGIIITIGKYAALFFGAAGVIKSLTQGETQTAIKNALWYGAGFGSLFLLKYILDAIESSVQ